MRGRAPQKVEIQMAADETRIYLFYADDDTEGTRRARALQTGLAKAGYDCRLVNKLSRDLGDLMLVAQYRIVEVPTWILIDAEGEELLRMLDMPSTTVAKQYLEAICH